jgi:hypothetical protein
MKRKTCFKCHETKPLTFFYKHPMMADGRLGKCSDCTRKDVQQNRQSKLAYYRRYDRRRGNRQTTEDRRRYRENNPIKNGARILVRKAIMGGRLARAERCEICAKRSRRLHAHHDDYAQPLVVRWLCAACHRQWHMANGRGLNG